MFDLRPLYCHSTIFITKAILTQPEARQTCKTGHSPLGFIPSSVHMPNWDKKYVSIGRGVNFSFILNNIMAI